MEQIYTTVNPLALNFSDVEQLFFVRQVIYLKGHRLQRPKQIMRFLDQYGIRHAYDPTTGTRVVAVTWKGTLIHVREFKCHGEAVLSDTFQGGVHAGVVAEALGEIYNLAGASLNLSGGMTYAEALYRAYQADPVFFGHRDVNETIGEILVNYHRDKVDDYVVRSQSRPGKCPEHHSYLLHREVEDDA